MSAQPILSDDCTGQVTLAARWLAEIAWQQPWYASVALAAQRLAALVRHTPDLHAVLTAAAAAQALQNSQGLALQFVPQGHLPAESAYESFIYASGQIPTRENLHDFFNALVWLSFPQLKQTLNAMQAAQIAQHGVGRVRGSVRDAITLFDENAALLMLPDNARGHALAQALREHAWPQVFAGFAQDIHISLFGHALMEKLLQPYKAITAHAWLVLAPDAVFAAPAIARQAWLDQQVAQQIGAMLAPGATPFSSACFSPLPVAGVPGWWPQQDAAFYADVSVFRPRRMRQAQASSQ